jgi:hypothetical protein
MNLTYLDSRTDLGTDLISLFGLSRWSDALKEFVVIYPPNKHIRVIIGKLGSTIRISAPSLNITIDGTTQQEVWEKFLNVIKRRDDSAWLTFDVGPTRAEEIQEGLDAPEDEEWPEMSDNSEE